MTVVLRADGLRFGWPGLPLFDRLDLAINPGVTEVRGGDGSGKTTLLKLLAGVLPADGGALTVGGVSLAAQPGTYRQRVFWADPSTAALDQTLATDWLDALRLQHAAWDDELLADLVDGFALAPHLAKPFFMLSTGSKRKVGLAAAFAAGTRVTLLDDPLAALDGRSAGLVRELLEEAAEHPSRAWVVACHGPLAGPRAAVIDLG